MGARAPGIPLARPRFVHDMRQRVAQGASRKRSLQGGGGKGDIWGGAGEQQKIHSNLIFKRPKGKRKKTWGCPNGAGGRSVWFREIK